LYLIRLLTPQPQSIADKKIKNDNSGDTASCRQNPHLRMLIIIIQSGTQASTHNNPDGVDQRKYSCAENRPAMSIPSPYALQLSFGYRENCCDGLQYTEPRNEIGKVPELL